MKTITPWYRHSLRTIYQRFIRIRGNPREIALGFALGLFIGFTPTMGGQILISIFLASLFKWNKITAAIGVQVTNPFTAPLIYGFTYVLGAKLIGLHRPVDFEFTFDWHGIVSMVDQAPRIFLALTIGGVIVGLPVAVIGYFASYVTFERYQQRLKEKLARQKDRLKQKMTQRKTRRQNRRQTKN